MSLTRLWLTSTFGISKTSLLFLYTEIWLRILYIGINYFILAFHLENKHQTPFWSKVCIFINISAESEDALSQSELRERQIFHHTFCEPQTSKGLQTKWTKLDHDIMIIINNILCIWREDNAINLYEGSKLPIYYKNVLIIKSEKLSFSSPFSPDCYLYPFTATWSPRGIFNEVQWKINKSN